MDGTAIIARFNLQTDQSSELSDTESLDLANEVYSDVQQERDWEWLKKVFTGNTSASLPYVALPSDFRQIIPNKDNEVVVFVGTELDEYTVVPFSSRRDYRDMGGFCYIDSVNMRLYFTKQPTSVKPIEFDYIMVAPDLTTSTSPVFPDKYHAALAYGMASKFDPIQLTDKAQSYQRENGGLFQEKLSNMRLEDAHLKLAR